MERGRRCSRRPEPATIVSAADYVEGVVAIGASNVTRPSSECSPFRDGELFAICDAFYERPDPLSPQLSSLTRWRTASAQRAAICATSSRDRSFSRSHRKGEADDVLLGPLVNAPQGVDDLVVEDERLVVEDPRLAGTQVVEFIRAQPLRARSAAGGTNRVRNPSLRAIIGVFTDGRIGHTQHAMSRSRGAFRHRPYVPTMALVPPNRLETEFVLENRPLHVLKLDGAWQVSYDGRTASERYLDHALARLLGGPPGSKIQLMCKILSAATG